MWRGGGIERERKKYWSSFLNMVLITVILDGFLFKYEVNKMNEKLLKYFENV